MFEITDARVKDIRGLFTDEKSLSVFDNRLMYNLTGDYRYIDRMVDESFSDAPPYKTLEYIAHSKKRKVIFGMGAFGVLAKINTRKVKWDGFVDNFPKSETFFDLPVLTPDHYIEKYGTDDTIFYIASGRFGDDMKKQLLEAGVAETDIYDYIKDEGYFGDRQYFDFWEPRGTESFVDCGGFNGLTSKTFINWCKKDYSKIWVFEPDPDNIHICEHILSGEPNVAIINSGVYNKTSDSVKFAAHQQFASKVSENGDIEINTISLDDLSNDEKVTFIKMDIEGAEYEALEGAKKILREQKPRLAISAYHKPEDIFTLPEIIRECNPDYKFALRHYSLHHAETVLYAE